MKNILTTIYNDFLGQTSSHPVIRRVLAGTIDLLIYYLGAGGIYLISDYFHHYTYQGQLIWCLIFWTTYLTAGNSKYFGGQTIGKKIFKIKVISEAGIEIGIIRAFIRSIPLALLTNYQLILLTFAVSDTSSKEVLSSIPAILIALFVGVIYFFGLKSNRQSLHDLIASTQVVNINSRTTTQKDMNPFIVLGYIILTMALLKVIIY